MDAGFGWRTTLADCGDWDHMWGGGWMWLWGTLMMLFWVVVVGLVVYWIVRASQAPRGAIGGRAKEILAERYARGELTTEEYNERLEALP